ncbi:MAG: BrnA antitoxin family protein [Alphaproteobacteria bacterium]
MKLKKPMIDEGGEVRNLTAEDMAQFKPATEMFSPGLMKKLGGRGPQKSQTKERITIRLSHEVVEQFRATGEGWQTRVDTALKDWLKSHWPGQ